MKRPLAPIKTPGATDARAGCNDFASHGSGMQGRDARHSTRRVVSPITDDLGPRRLARIAQEIRWLFGSRAIPHYRSAHSAHLLIEALDERATGHPDLIDAHDFEDWAAERLNVLIEGASSGFGEFDARVNIDGTVTFVGEPNAAWQVILGRDHLKNVRRRRRQPGLPRILIEIRSIRKIFDCWSLGNAFHLLQQAKADAINTFCVEARRDATHGGEVRREFFF